MMSQLSEQRLGKAVKAEVIDELGEKALLLPMLVNRGLDANGRAKYLLSLLQAGRAHADEPMQRASSLRDERVGAGISDPTLDVVVENSQRKGPDCYFVPQAARIHHDLVVAIEEMLAPINVAAPDPEQDLDARRLDALLAQAPAFAGDEVPGSYIDKITSARRERGDSLHQVVLDAHRALNRMQAQIATEAIDGAAVYDLDGDDPQLVAGFMAGVHETMQLKFDHPGMGTSATRVGRRLLIQNDLGMTNAHVVVLSVEGLTATLTYTDVHLRRMDFFISLFDDFAMHWGQAERRHGTASLGEHHVAVGRFDAPDRSSLIAFLRRVGSRLVFVIDWNRARKRLGKFLAVKDAIDVLRWAADNNVGHMAFLLLGGERLVFDAVELSARVPARYGEPLIDVLGREATLSVTRFALRVASEGMLAGKSLLLIRDELRVEVLRHIQASQRRLLDALSQHASLIVECARALQAGLLRLQMVDGDAFLQRSVERAARWEHRADEVLTALRQKGRRVDGGETITALAVTADDAIDNLEESIFLLSLLPPEAVGIVRGILGPLAAITALTASEYLKAVEGARWVVDGSPAEDLEDLLVAVDQVATCEHDADSASRAARAALVVQAPDFRSLYVADSVASGAEAATDALLSCALRLRDHILGTLASR